VFSGLFSLVSKIDSDQREYLLEKLTAQVLYLVLSYTIGFDFLNSQKGIPESSTSEKSI
jgi:hypothetical protein